MKLSRHLAVFLLLCPSLFLQAQSHDGGALLNLGFEQRIVKNFNFNLEAEARTKNCFTTFNRLKIGTSFDYSFLKKKRLKVSLGANYLLYNDGGTAEHRGRVLGAITYSEKIHHFKLSLRARAQATFYDETRRDVKFNPKTYLRGRFQCDYNIPQKHQSVYASTEFFLPLYQKGHCHIDNFRTIVGWNIALNNANSLGVFLRMDNEVQAASPENMYYLGVKYQFSHK